MKNFTLLLILVCSPSLAVNVLADCPPARWLGPSQARSLSCRYDDTLTRLFTPLSVPTGTYRVYVTQAPLGRIAALFRDAARQPDSWGVQQLEPLDAFGAAGGYDRSKVARLYVGTRARVARGPVLEDGVVVASIWLISPYPDPSLSRLESGTMIIEYRIERR